MKKAYQLVVGDGDYLWIEVAVGMKLFNPSVLPSKTMILYTVTEVGDEYVNIQCDYYPNWKFTLNPEQQSGIFNVYWREETEND